MLFFPQLNVDNLSDLRSSDVQICIYDKMFLFFTLKNNQKSPHLHIVVRKLITLVGMYRDFVFMPFFFTFSNDQYESPLFTQQFFFIIPSTQLISV